MGATPHGAKNNNRTHGVLLRVDGGFAYSLQSAHAGCWRQAPFKATSWVADIIACAYTGTRLPAIFITSLRVRLCVHDTSLVKLHSQLHRASQTRAYWAPAKCWLGF